MRTPISLRKDRVRVTDRDSLCFLRQFPVLLETGPLLVESVRTISMHQVYADFDPPSTDITSR